MNNSFILTGLFMVGLDIGERRLLIEDAPKGNGFQNDCENVFNFPTVFATIMDQVLTLDSAERQEWIDIIINEGATPTISTVTGTACIAL